MMTPPKELRRNLIRFSKREHGLWELLKVFLFSSAVVMGDYKQFCIIEKSFCRLHPLYFLFRSFLHFHLAFNHTQGLFSHFQRLLMASLLTQNRTIIQIAETFIFILKCHSFLDVLLSFIKLPQFPLTTC
jgi:hypothetical protein